jgi:hypothetical protein
MMTKFAALWIRRIAHAVYAFLLSIPLSTVGKTADNISIYSLGHATAKGFHGHLIRGATGAGNNLGVKVTSINPD